MFRFIVFIFSFLIVNSIGQEVPRVNLFAPPIKPEIGSKTSFTCQAMAGSLPVHISWFKDGKEISEMESTRIRTNEDVSIFMVDSIKSIHSGNFTCKISNRFGSDFGSIELKVEGSPNWNEKPGNIKIHFGEHGSSRCSAYGFPKPSIEWKRFKGSTWEKINSFDDKLKIDSNELIITKADSKHSGRYGCVVTNGIEPNLWTEFEVSIDGKCV